MFELYNDFFAAGCGPDGFRSYFDSVFSAEKLDRLYVIIGGSGSGKSTLMKRIAEHFSDLGHSVEIFRCSADSASLDGVIIDEKIALADGTPPHSIIPSYPGAFEKVINTGDCWDSSVLYSERGRIKKLIIEKSLIYMRAYRYLRAAGELERERQEIIKNSILTDKLERFADRFVKENITGKGSTEREVRPIKALTSEGIFEVHGLEKKAEKTFSVSDNIGAGGYLLNTIAEKASNCGKVIYSPSLLMKSLPDALYFGESRTLLIVRGRNEILSMPEKLQKQINIERFINKEIITANRNKLRFSSKCIEALQNGAEKCFSEAALLHSEIEKIYFNAMDFEKSAKLIEDVTTEIESIL